MIFQLSKSQKEIQKAAREFAKGEFDKDLSLEHDKDQTFPETIRRKAAELGFIGIHYPEKYHGAGLGAFENALIAEEFCKKDSSMGMALMLSGFSSECILRFDPGKLKEKFLSKVLDGQTLSGAAFTETNSGYEINDLKTSAVKEGDEWVVNGYKTYVVNGGEAGFYCVLCQTDPDNKSPDNISMILVEGDREGLSSVKGRNKLGMRMSALSDLRFKNVRVPFSNLIGKEGRGARQALAFYDENRILTAAMALGAAKGAFARALDYVKKREQFGKKIAQFQVTQHKLANMAILIEQADFMTYVAAMNFDRGKSDSAMIAMAKISACRAALEVSSEAVQLLGGYGYMIEYEVERFYRDAKVMEVFCGNTGVLKDIVAGKVIGKIK
jgi:alkylation response protein AidB-like acyl-CoA dehydrogenase